MHYFVRVGIANLNWFYEKGGGIDIPGYTCLTINYIMLSLVLVIPFSPQFYPLSFIYIHTHPAWIFCLGCFKRAEEFIQFHWQDLFMCGRVREGLPEQGPRESVRHRKKMDTKLRWEPKVCTSVNGKRLSYLCIH